MATKRNHHSTMMLDAGPSRSVNVEAKIVSSES